MAKSLQLEGALAPGQWRKRRSPARERRRTSARPRGKVMAFCPDAFTAWHFHRALLLALKSQGYQVSVLAPPVHPGDVRGLVDAGLTHVPIALERFIAPVADLRSIVRLYQIFRHEKPDFVHSFNLKCHIYGAIAARLARVPHIVGTIEGLGFSYAAPRSTRDRALRLFMDLLNRIACAACEKVWFLNGDDAGLFLAKHILPERKAVLVRSCGINTRDFSLASVEPGDAIRLRAELGLDETAQIVTMVVARAIWSKGVGEFLEAARRLERSEPAARFILLAPIEHGNPRAVPERYLETAEAALPNFLWLRELRRDVRALLAISDVCVLPSYYREGVPKILLEAMAMGKAIVTTDNVGCREVVEHGHNGFLVPVKNGRALATATRVLLQNPAVRGLFGRRSREKVEAEFSERVVVGNALRALYGSPVAARYTSHLPRAHAPYSGVASSC